MYIKVSGVHLHVTPGIGGNITVYVHNVHVGEHKGIILLNT